MEHKLSDSVQELVISRHLIVDVQPHPEDFSGFIAVLDNDMSTDAYEREDGSYVSYTNNQNLIDYVENKKRGERKMKKYVKIQSQRNIQLTGGLQFLDMTDANQPIANKMKVQPLWSKEKLIIKAGSNWYPSYITQWSTTKALNEDGIITIGEFADKLPANVTAEAAAEVLEHEEKLKQAQMEVERQTSAMTKHKKLKDIALPDKE